MFMSAKQKKVFNIYNDGRNHYLINGRSKIRYLPRNRLWFRSWTLLLWQHCRRLQLIIFATLASLLEMNDLQLQMK